MVKSFLSSLLWGCWVGEQGASASAMSVSTKPFPDPAAQWESSSTLLSGWLLRMQAGWCHFYFENFSFVPVGLRIESNSSTCLRGLGGSRFLQLHLMSLSSFFLPSSHMGFTYALFRHRAFAYLPPVWSTFVLLFTWLFQFTLVCHLHGIVRPSLAILSK